MKKFLLPVLSLLFVFSSCSGILTPNDTSLTINLPGSESRSAYKPENAGLYDVTVHQCDAYGEETDMILASGTFKGKKIVFKSIPEGKCFVEVTARTKDGKSEVAWGRSEVVEVVAGKDTPVSVVMELFEKPDYIIYNDLSDMTFTFTDKNTTGVVLTKDQEEKITFKLQVDDGWYGSWSGSFVRNASYYESPEKFREDAIQSLSEGNVFDNADFDEKGFVVPNANQSTNHYVLSNLSYNSDYYMMVVIVISKTGDDSEPKQEYVYSSVARLKGQLESSSSGKDSAVLLWNGNNYYAADRDFENLTIENSLLQSAKFSDFAFDKYGCLYTVMNNDGTGIIYRFNDPVKGCEDWDTFDTVFGLEKMAFAYDDSTDILYIYAEFTDYNQKCIYKIENPSEAEEIDLTDQPDIFVNTTDIIKDFAVSGNNFYFIADKEDNTKDGYKTVSKYVLQEQADGGYEFKNEKSQAYFEIGKSVADITDITVAGGKVYCTVCEQNDPVNEASGYTPIDYCVRGGLLEIDMDLNNYKKLFYNENFSSLDGNGKYNTDDNYLYGAQKFIAHRSGKLVIADDGGKFGETADNVNINRVVTVDISKGTASMEAAETNCEFNYKFEYNSEMIEAATGLNRRSVN